MKVVVDRLFAMVLRTVLVTRSWSLTLCNCVPVRLVLVWSLVMVRPYCKLYLSTSIRSITVTTVMGPSWSALRISRWNSRLFTEQVSSSSVMRPPALQVSTLNAQRTFGSEPMLVLGTS